MRALKSEATVSSFLLGDTKHTAFFAPSDSLSLWLIFSVVSLLQLWGQPKPQLIPCEWLLTSKTALRLASRHTDLCDTSGQSCLRHCLPQLQKASTASSSQPRTLSVTSYLTSVVLCVWGASLTPGHGTYLLSVTQLCKGKRNKKKTPFNSRYTLFLQTKPQTANKKTQLYVNKQE